MKQKDNVWKFFKVKKIYREDGKLYLWRLYILRTPWFGVMLHKIMDDDPDCLHDHPWSFVSFILKGGYEEIQSYDNKERHFEESHGRKYIEQPHCKTRLFSKKIKKTLLN